MRSEFRKPEGGGRKAEVGRRKAEVGVSEFRSFGGRRSEGMTCVKRTAFSTLDIQTFRPLTRHLPFASIRVFRGSKNSESDGNREAREIALKQKE